ncbi:hypothetical protein NDA01_03555 [Trichocoleus desertorum AS-A10]|uniref:hypothetical protein n=1 Tax=Trichocoleus desertorum TaxID=1481672 RepID=UPI0032979638
MPLLIKAEQLTSRAIRKQTTGGKPRLLDLSKRFVPVTKDKTFLGRIFDFGRSLGGFISGAINLIRNIAVSATGIFGWLLARVEQLKQFDWNASDAELRQQMKGQNVQLAAIWGTALGNATGWLVGVGVGYGVSFLCPVIGGAALARTVATAAGTEALEEITAGIGGALRATAGIMANRAVTWGYINYRRLLKRVPKPILERLYGKSGANFIKNTWGNEGEPIISFNSEMDEFVESIQSETTRAFVENFLEESWEGFTEAGFIVAAEIDNAYAQSKQANSEALGQTRIVELTPDKNNKEEKILLVAEEKLIRPQIISTLSQHRLLHNRDVGQWVGSPVDDSIRAKFLNRKIEIVFRAKESPPYYMPGGKRCKVVTCSIPDTKPGVTWKDIKAAASPYMWGSYLLVAKLDNGRQMQIHGATKQAAQKKLEQLLKLSTAKVLKLTGSNEVLVNPRNKKPATKVYPSFASLLIRAKSSDQEGRTNMQGQVFDEKLIKFDLYTKEPPEGLPSFNQI